MYVGAQLPWGTINPGGWLGDDAVVGTSRMALVGTNPLPWATINPGGYLGDQWGNLGDTNTNDVISQGIQTVGQVLGQIFGPAGNQNAVPTPGTGLTVPVVQQQAAGPFGGIPMPILLGGVAILAVMLLRKR